MQQKESKTNKHFRVSMIKSGVRMIGCAALMFGNYGRILINLYYVKRKSNFR